MPTVVGVVFSRPGKLYHFNSGDLDLAIDDKVIVKTENGTDMGTVLEVPKDVTEEELRAPLKPVLHRATKSEIEKAEEFALQAPEALSKAKELVSKRRIPMKVISAEYSYDGRKITYFFNSEDRVDFRDLVKDLSGDLKVRVDMRQIGVRDAARCVDGCGPCGQQLCCARHLTDFPPISVRMAKDQDLPLNPGKDFKKRAPSRGTVIQTEARGEVLVCEVKPMKESVVVELSGGEREELRLTDSGKLEAIPKKIEESPFGDLFSGEELPKQDNKPGGGQRRGPQAQQGNQPQRPEGESAANADGTSKPKRRRRRNRKRKKKADS